MRLRQDEFTEGFVDADDLITTGPKPIDGIEANEFCYALDNLAVAGPARVLPGMQHQLEICASAAIEVNALRINFSN